jgi:VanZ family protein
MKAFLRKNALWLTLLPVLALMTGIFCFSAQPAAASQQTSGGIVSWLLRLLVPDFAGLDPARQAEIEHIVAKVVRKSAHFAEYALLGATLLGHMLAWRARRGLGRPRTLAFGVGALYAASDELHQLFVPGRSGELLDVLLDSAGVAVGVALLWLLLRKRTSAA